MPDEHIRAESQLTIEPGRDGDAEGVLSSLGAEAEAAGIAVFGASFGDGRKTINVSFEVPDYPTFEKTIARLGPLLARFDGIARVGQLRIVGGIPDRMKDALGRVTPNLTLS